MQDLYCTKNLLFCTLQYLNTAWHYNQLYFSNLPLYSLVLCLHSPCNLQISSQLLPELCRLPYTVLSLYMSSTNKLIFLHVRLPVMCPSLIGVLLLSHPHKHSRPSDRLPLYSAPEGNCSPHPYFAFGIKQQLATTVNDFVIHQFNCDGSNSNIYADIVSL